MIRNSLSKDAISAAADDVRLLFNDPPTTMPVLHLPSFTAHAILRAEVSLVDAIDNNQPPGFISKATRWSSIVGLVILDTVGRALGVDHEMAILAQTSTRQSCSTPTLTFASNSSTSSNSSIQLPPTTMATSTTSPITNTKATTPTTAAIHMTSTPHMTPSTSTTNRTGKAASTKHQGSPQSYSASVIISGSVMAADTTNAHNGSLRRSDGQRNLTNIYSNVSPTDLPSSSIKSLTASKAALPPESQEAAEEEPTQANRRHIRQHFYHHPTSSPLIRNSSSPHQRGMPVPFATLSPVLAFKRTSCTPRFASPANPSPSAPFKRTCCILRPSHQRRPWRQ